MIKKAIPLFPQTNVEKATEFYRDKMGFKILFIYDENYGGVIRDEFVLHFWKCEDKHIAENTSCRVEVEDVETLFNEYSKSKVIHPNGNLETKPWGYKEFSILDEAGNLINFVEEIPKK